MPTREEIEVAREAMRALLSIHGNVLGPNYTVHVRVLLAATEPPTDAELTLETPRVYSTSEHHAIYAHGYCDGARREGRR